MSDIIYYLSRILLIVGTPTLIVLTIILIVKPHHINKRLKTPISRKQILIVGIISVLVSFFGFGSVMAATEPAAVRNAVVNSSKITIKTVTVTEPIAFSSTTKNDNTIPSGQTKISVQGVDGTRTIAYEVTYTNNKETSRKQVSSVVTTKPIDQVTLIGTYIAPTAVTTSNSDSSTSCSNGTYVNSAGNTVCRPEASSTAPEGATAQCSDGTYSYSQSRRGTCSHHGGVASWL